MKLSWLRKQFYRRVEKRSYHLVRRNGIAYLLTPAHSLDRFLLERGEFEQAQLDYLLAAMRRTPADAFLDIGANLGLYSLTVARETPTPEIVAFEPNLPMLYQLQANVLLNDAVDQITIVPKAASDRTGPIAFLRSMGGNPGISRVQETAPPTRKPKKWEETSIEAIRLDEFYPYRDQTVFIKLDVEGHEAAVLDGMPKLFANNRCFLQVEAFPANEERLTSVMAGYGMKKTHQVRFDHFFQNF